MGGTQYAKTHVFKEDLKQVLAPVESDAFVKTKVCITMGPNMTADLLANLLEAGATCCRIDLTWQNIDQHRKSLQMLQEAMKRTRRLCAVMLDCLGRDVLVRSKYTCNENGWPTQFQMFNVSEGQQVTLTTAPDAECTEDPVVLPVTYSRLHAMVHPGDSICLGQYLATGADKSSLFLEVAEVRSGCEVVCVARNGAVLDGLVTVFHQERSAEGLSNLQNSMPALDAWDKQAIAVLASEFEVDFVSLSYCRSREDVDEARTFLASIGREGIKVVAKCETRQALMHFTSICSAADAIIIARGNLGLDVAPEKMAMVQKAMIGVCNSMGTPAIVARVVDTMALTPRPTRAEATDVANAVLDGADCIMLGAETYRGLYPLDTVRTVAAICREAEAVFDHHSHYEHLIMEGTRDLRELHAELGEAGAGAGEDGHDDHDPEVPRSHQRLRLRLQASPGFCGDGFDSSGEELSPALALSSGGSPRHGGAGAGGRAVSRTVKLESIASAAVRAADKVGAALIVCITHTGRTASMIARYRPPMPIMALVVPYLKNEGLRWTLEGRSIARQALLTSGLLPVLAAPTPSVGESLLEEAIAMAAGQGLVKAHDHVVAVALTASREAMVKVVSVNESGRGIKKIRPTGLLDMLRAAASWKEAAAPQPHQSPARSPVAAAPGTAGAEGSPTAARTYLRRGSVIIGSRADPLVPVDEGEDADDEN